MRNVVFTLLIIIFYEFLSLSRNIVVHYNLGKVAEKRKRKSCRVRCINSNRCSFQRRITTKHFIARTDAGVNRPLARTDAGGNRPLARTDAGVNRPW